uniref:Palladin-like n=1 Tax=Phallusia mammillata TaxID=59560 RepID=A0A6F9DNM6_9ASCI|nr:palladin-like [Phallusia mammillata]
MAVVITLTGGSPWGFKMKGGKDFHQPLAIAKVTAGGKASRSGVIEGYIIEKVNGDDFANLGHHEAQNKIKSAGATLTMHLSKPKTGGQAPAPYVTTVPEQPKPSVTYQPGETRYQKYEDAGNWQKEGTITQSPAMNKALVKPYKAPVRAEEKKAISITPEIKEMLEEEEKSKEEAPGSMKASEVKTWPSHDVSSSNGVLPSESAPPANGNADRSKAIGNIGKFFQGSAAPRYGEPTFAKALQDIAAPMGEPAVLEVRLGSNMPTPSVHWYHNNKPARESKEKDIRFLSNGPVHTVVLGELSPELLGTYTCTIMNKYGSKSSRCRVTVKTDGTNHQTTQQRSNSVPPSNVKDSKRVVASTSLGLYSSQNVKDSYQGQMKQSPTKDDNEESEVLKALREDAPQRTFHQPRSMKYLEESLLPESDDL